MTTRTSRGFLARVIMSGALIIGALPATVAGAMPFLEPDDTLLRQDLEYLNDRGVIHLPITSWPLTLPSVQIAVASATEAPLDPSLAAALARVQSRVLRESKLGYGFSRTRIALSDNSRRLRIFDESPRANAEADATFGYFGDRFAGQVRLGVAANAQDSQSFRADGSYLAGVFGNAIVSAGWQDKWWGPGWGGTLGLSTSARPVPGILIQRNISAVSDWGLLRWLGPWAWQVSMGRKDSDRAVPNPYLFGMRVTIKPLRRLELGVSRTAQWGGEGRPENLDSFFNMLIGRDNEGSDGLSDATEPGNQLAGFDARWSVLTGPRTLTVYGQIMGEDEAGGFPSRYLGQFGASSSFRVGDDGARLALRLEYSDTTCQFHENSRIFNCAYNNSQFPTGYRYRGLPIGHSTDNDAAQVLLGAEWVSARGHNTMAMVRRSRLNRGGAPDAANSLTPTPKEIENIEISHRRDLFDGQITAGFGVDRSRDELTGASDTDVRAFLQWTRSFLE